MPKSVSLVIVVLEHVQDGASLTSSDPGVSDGIPNYDHQVSVERPDGVASGEMGTIPLAMPDNMSSGSPLFEGTTIIEEEEGEFSSGADSLGEA
ncbi:hypothetical protein U1Q18_043119 [Sarracenia purpurea var. burkii]